MDYLGKTCPVCSQNFHEGDDVVVCPKCGAPYHRGCYQEKGKCLFTDLHQSKKSWHEVYDDDPTADNEETVKCFSCGTMNAENAIVCKNCGSFLSQSVSKHIRDDTDDESEDQDTREDFEGKIPAGPFSFLIDPMGGVAKNEDFDGVTAAELSKYVNANTQYYIPLFARIKKMNKSKINFAAFFFTGAWFLYRKQYLKGAIIALLYLIVELSSIFLVSAVSLPLYREANAAFAQTNLSHPMIGNYLSWAYDHYSFGGSMLILLPYLLYAFRFGICLFSGLTANRGYYQFCIRKTKLAKQRCADGDTMKAISEAGGVNTAIAWTFFACYVILYITSLFA